MDKETLSNYGWIVICVLVLAVMLALATPFGTFIADGFKATYTGLFDTGDSALDVGLSAVGVTNTLECGHGRKESGDHSQKECGHYNCDDIDCGCVPASCGTEGHWSGDGKDHTAATSCDVHEYVCQCDGWVVPEGGTYHNPSRATTYNEGQRLPCSYTPIQGDYFKTSCYIYTYSTTGYQSGSYSERHPGWHVEATDKTLDKYPAIENSILNEPVTSLYRTFANCKSLTNNGVPTIPTNITNMYSAFVNCTALTDLSNLVIPENVTEMPYTFNGCSNLAQGPCMSNANKLEKVMGTFQNCTSLTGTISLPCKLNISSYSGCPATISYYHVDGCNGSCGH